MTNTRPPIVTILGHVDHGKTTLLDYIRSSHLAERETGGITQKIGAYQANFNDRLITFIDTPGHAAFSQMRSRGASVADVAVLVLAADDGVMPQTIESIKHIKAAAVPFVVAINKTDKPGTNPELPKAQLTKHGVFVEGYGGNTPFVLISAKTGAGVDTLLETILLLAELEELVNDPDAALTAPVIESKLDMKRGVLVSSIIKSGTLHTGDTVYVGLAPTKIRSLISHTGTQISSATPGTPVQLLGFRDVPAVGSVITDLPLTANPTANTEDPVVDPAATPTNRLKLILRADSIGALEALHSSFTDEIQIISEGTGDVAESDVLLARPTGAIILAYAVKTPASVAKLAELEGVTIKSYAIIYELLEYLEKKILRLMEPTIDEETLGEGSVLKVFEINADHIAGTRVTSGRLEVGDLIHLKRGDETKNARIKSLRVGKSEVKVVESGSECGLHLSPNLDIREKDVIISYKKIKTED